MFCHDKKFFCTQLRGYERCFDLQLQKNRYKLVSNNIAHFDTRKRPLHITIQLEH